MRGRDIQRLSRLEERDAAIHDLMEAKFVTFRTLIDANDEKARLALAAADKAITKSEGASEKRFDAVNEFRAMLNDIIAGLVRQDYLEQALQARDERLSRLEERNRQLELDRSSGEGGHARVADQRAGVVAAVAVATLVLGILVFVANYAFGA